MSISAALSSKNFTVSPAEVVLKNVSKNFGRGSNSVNVLDDISLTVAQGEIVVLLGPSGCGKSTLLRLIAGLETKSSGQVQVDGHEVVGIDPRTSVVFQEPRLLPWRSIRKNIELGTRGADRGEVIDSLIAAVGLSGFENHLPRQVSGGMAQRAALARALSAYPGVLLLDEPFAALDALTRLQMQDLLLEVAATAGSTVILVTHDIDEALHLADRVVVLGERGTGIAEIVEVNQERPRDRSHPALAPLRTELLSRFGIHP